MPPLHFVAFLVISMAAFVPLLLWSLHGRIDRPSLLQTVWVSMIVVAGGMGFAKIGANAGLPPTIYYGVPALTTLVLPPVVFRMGKRELLQYSVLALAFSPAIHVLFSLLLGWHEYLPFWHVPSIWGVLNAGN